MLAATLKGKVFFTLMFVAILKGKVFFTLMLDAVFKVKIFFTLMFPALLLMLGADLHKKALSLFKAVAV